MTNSSVSFAMDKSNISYASCFVLYPLIIACLSVVAYQQAQVKSTSVSCSSQHPASAACHPIASQYIIFSK